MVIQNCTAHQILLRIWNCLRDNNYVFRFHRIRYELTARTVREFIFWHKSADQFSLEDQDKQQICFFVIRFIVKYSDRLVATTVLKVLDLQCLKVLGSFLLSLQLCKILVRICFT